MADIPETFSPEITEKYTTGNNAFGRGLKTDWKDKIEVVVGDDKQPSSFYPQVKMMRWDNEVNASFRLKDEQTASEVVSTDENKIVWTKGKVEAYFYETEKGYEFEVVLKEKPLTNKIEFTIRTKGVNFFYQPELTQEEIDEGASRPENAIGSYAIYTSEEKMNFNGGKEYRAGKVGHIFRPKIIDSAGAEVWAELNIDIGRELLTITIPQDFLDNAVYPIIVDPTIGTTTTGVSVTQYGVDTWRGEKATAGSSGDITAVTSWSDEFSAGTSGFKGVVCNSSLNILSNGVGADCGDVASGPAWFSSTYSTSPSITSGNAYWIGAVATADNNTLMYFDTVTADGTHGHDGSNSYSSPTNPTDADTTRTQRYTIYATYTASGTTSTSLTTSTTSSSTSISTSTTSSSSSTSTTSTSISTTTTSSSISTSTTSSSSSISTSTTSSSSSTSTTSTSISTSTTSSSTSISTSTTSSSTSLSTSTTSSSSSTSLTTSTTSSSISTSTTSTSSSTSTTSTSISTSTTSSSSSISTSTTSSSTSLSTSTTSSSSSISTTTTSSSTSQTTSTTSSSSSISTSTTSTSTTSTSSSSSSTSTTVTGTTTSTSTSSTSISTSTTSSSTSLSTSTTSSSISTSTTSSSTSISTSTTSNSSSTSTTSTSLSTSTTSSSSSSSTSTTTTLPPTTTSTTSTSSSSSTSTTSTSSSSSTSTTSSSSSSSISTSSISTSTTSSSTTSTSTTSTSTTSSSTSTTLAPVNFYKNGNLYYEIDDGISIMLGQWRISTWVTVGRPTGVKGQIGYNTQLGQLEIFDGSAWNKIALSAV